jgi:NADPH:quinone reductase-like Zn-dependent oxidoreductase
MSSESSSYALHLAAKASGIDTLQLDCQNQAMPSIAEGEVVVQVMAAAVNPSDVKATLGIMPHAVFPRTPGRDFAGIVVAGPDALKGLKVWGSGGDIGITRNGSHARYLVLPVDAVKEVPKGISMEEAGAVGVPFVTACEGFSRAGGVKAGQTVVVLGANGKVGQAAVQIAARAGAKVIAVQRQDQLEGFACADVEVINSTHMEPATRIMDLTGGKGANLVFNTVDKVYWEVGHAVMAKGATQIFIIATKGQTVAFDLFKFYRGMHNFVGIDTLALDCVRSCELLDELRPGFEDGSLKPFPVASADMIDLPNAMRAYKEVLSGAKNRIVLKP